METISLSDEPNDKPLPPRPPGTPNTQLRSLSSAEKDTADLARLGKKEVLKRNFGFVPIVGFASTVIVTWEATFLGLSLELPGGGPAGLVYGFILVWIGMLAVFTTVGEMASIAPTSGGQYYWVFLLAPVSSRKFLSYITGWVTLIGWQAMSISTVYICATIIQGLIYLGRPSYDPALWQGVLLIWAIILFCIFFNTTISHFLPHVEGIGLIMHIVGFFAVLTPLIYLGPHADAGFVFTTFFNAGNWPTQGLSFCITLNVAVFDFLGSDCVIHMSEEIRNAATVVPQSLIFSLFVNGVLGLASLIATLFCMGDLQAVLNSPYPYMEIFQASTGSTTGAFLMTIILLIMQTFATIGLVAATSRMFWAFARDRGLPGWKALSKVSTHKQNPTVAVGATVLITCLLGLLNLTGPVLFDDVLSLTVSALYLSYFLVCVLLLWRRCTGFISPPTQYPQKLSISSHSPAILHWGPFHIPGLLGIALNVVSCSYLLLIIFFSSWPTQMKPSWKTMNMSVLMLGATVVGAVGWYGVRGRRDYKGPIIEVPVEESK